MSDQLRHYHCERKVKHRIEIRQHDENVYTWSWGMGLVKGRMGMSKQTFRSRLTDRERERNVPTEKHGDMPNRRGE